MRLLWRAADWTTPGSFVVAITTSEKSISSEELAVKLDHNASSGISDISIVVGATPPEYNETLTLSQMEMDFGLQTTVLFERFIGHIE